MKTTYQLVCLLGVTTALAFGRATEPDLGKIADRAIWRIVNRAATLVEGPDRKAVRLDARDGDGVAWLTGLDFMTGTIEVDLRGSNTPGRSFVGISLRGADDKIYDVIYFRPFNFKNPEAERRAHAVQYVSMPQFPWEILRAQFPGKYESAVSPVPDPDGWFHARLVVEDRKISVYVDAASTPCLIVTELSDRPGGRLGLWAGNGSDGTFANLKVTPRDR